VKKFLLMIATTFMLQADETESVCMNWKDSIMMQWHNMSHMHKLLVTGLVGLTLIWIVWRIIQCGKGGCGCHCGDNCTCKL